MIRKPDTAAKRPEVFIGIDWGEKEHVVCLLADDGPAEHRRLPQDPQAIAEWVAEMKARFPDRAVGVALEQSRGALIHALLACGGLQLYPVNPKQLAHYRTAFSPSGAKNDPGDAALLAGFLREHHGRLRRLVPDDPATRQLARLVELRRREVEERKRVIQQLSACLKLYFPLLLELFGSRLADELVPALLKRWPSLAMLKRVHPGTWRKFLSEHGLRNHDRQTELFRRMRAATPLTTDEAIVAPQALYAKSLARRLAELNDSLAAFDEQIAAVVATHPDEPLFRSVPGAGDVLVPRLIAAFGTDRSRFQNAEDVQTASGIAPITKQSGQTRQTVKRFHCPKFLRQTFHEFADHARKWSPWSRAFYRMKRAAGFRHHAALRALAFKWIRILFRLWQTRTPYDENYYLNRLRRHGSPVLKFLEPATKP